MTETMLNARRRNNGEPLEAASTDASHPQRTQVLEPNPAAHAKVLVMTYGRQHASWIAQSNVGSARPRDVEYWSCVLRSVRRTRRMPR